MLYSNRSGGEGRRSCNRYLRRIGSARGEQSSFEVINYRSWHRRLVDIRRWGALILATLVLFQAEARAQEYYKVQVTRKSQDLYEIVGQGIYIVTRYCYEYSYSEDAIVKIDNQYGYSIGQLTFLNGGTQCDIAKLLR